jgi:hypothetical protein
MSDKQIINLYLDYVNNFLTVKRFANYYNISESRALKIIDKGRKLLNKGAKK